MAGLKFIKKKKEVNEVIRDTFAEKGFHATSMRDIAEKLNMNKASLYYYIKSKERALYTIIDEEMDEALSSIENLMNQGISPEERLSQILEYYTRRFVTDKNRLILLINEFGALDDKHQQSLIKKQRKLLSMFVSIIEELKANGKLKDLHTMVVIFSFFGMAHYTVKWFDRGGSVTIDDLAMMFKEILTKGIFR
jgi:TetR/AcrR family transcriptional regulator, cholesterol catabolism regulator